MVEGQRLECSDAELKAAMGPNATSLGGEKRGRGSPLRWAYIEEHNYLELSIWG